MYFPQNNIQQVFQRLHGLLQEEYSGEDLQIIACPSMEQVHYCDMTFLLTSAETPINKVFRQ